MAVRCYSVNASKERQAYLNLKPAQPSSTKTKQYRLFYT